MRTVSCILTHKNAVKGTRRCSIRVNSFFSVDHLLEWVFGSFHKGGEKLLIDVSLEPFCKEVLRTFKFTWLSSTHNTKVCGSGTVALPEGSVSFLSVALCCEGSKCDFPLAHEDMSAGPARECARDLSGARDRTRFS